MDVLLIIAGFVMAYLLGSLPTSVWLGQAYFGIDVRDFGSGNAGATNTFRVLGRKAGIIVMLVDILKGWTATSLALLLYLMNVIPFDDLLMYKLLFGILSVIGHIFPVYVGFKGGKGVGHAAGHGAGHPHGSGPALHRHLLRGAAHLQVRVAGLHDCRPGVSPSCCCCPVSAPTTP
jgi:acyl-phosphate glycerol 3-phosphate acyltransferase